MRIEVNVHIVQTIKNLDIVQRQERTIENMSQTKSVCIMSKVGTLYKIKKSSKSSNAL